MVGELWEGLTDGESLLVVGSYATTESDKTSGTTGLLLSSGKNKSLDLTIMGSLNTPITTKHKQKIINQWICLFVVVLHPSNI